MVALSIFSIPVLVAANSAQSSQFAAPIKLSLDNSAAYPNVQAFGSNVYVAWSEGSRGIYFRSSANDGETWNPPTTSQGLLISQNVGVAQFPLIASNVGGGGSNVYVTWAQVVGSTGLQIFESTIANNGTGPVSTVQITRGNASATGGYITPVIASWGSHVYVAYYNTTGPVVNVVSSSNAGKNWSAPFANTGSGSSRGEPQLYASGNYAYIAADSGLSYTKNDGSTWTHVRIKGGCCGAEPWVWGAGSNVYVAWETKNTTSQAILIRSTDNGAKWSAHYDLSNSSIFLNDTWAPMIWAYGNSVWIATQEYPGGAASRIYVYTSTNAGANWTSPVLLSGTPGTMSDTSFPFTVMSSDGTHVFVAWSQQESPGHWVMRASSSSNGGTSWSASPGINVSGNSNGEAGTNNDVANGAMAASGANCYVVWQYESSAGNQIFFAGP